MPARRKEYDRCDTYKKVLDAYAEKGTVTAACRCAGISRETFYRWLKEDPKFKAAVDDAYEQVTDDLEESALERAKKDTTLTIFLLKGRKRGVYGDKQELSGPDGGPIQVDAIQKLDARIAAIAKRRGKAKATQEPDSG